MSEISSVDKARQDEANQSCYNVKAAHTWHTLSPWAIATFFFNTIWVILSNAYALLPIVYAGWNVGLNPLWLALGVGLFLGGILTFAVLSWTMFSYRIQTAQLDIRSGIVFKKTDEIPFNKIQNVRLQQPIYFKPLKLYSLVVETAGSKKNEAQLSAIGYRQAVTLKQQLLSETLQQTQNKAATNTNTLAQNANANTQSNVIETRSIKQLIQFGFYQNNAIWLAVILGPLLSQFNGEALLEYVLIEQSITWINSQVQSSPLIKIGFIAIGLILFYLLFALVSITASILKYHPYSLQLHQQTLTRSGGILAKQNDALKLRRIQMMVFSQPLIARFLKLWTLNFKQVQGNDIEQNGKHMLVPSMTRHQIGELLPKLSGIACNTTKLPVDYIGINKIWLYTHSKIVIAALIVAIVVLQDLLLIGLASAIAGLLLIAVYLRYRQWGYVIENKDLWIHSGLLGHKWHCIPFKKVQHIKVVQTPGLRKRHLAHLEIGLASGLQYLPCIPLDTASQLAENMLSEISLDKSNWI